MPACSSVGSRSTSAAVFALPMTKSGCAASSASALGSFTPPRFTTVSGRPSSNCVQVSSAAATSVSFPPARHHTSAKLPMSAATRFGLSTVTVRPSASVNVTARASALPDAALSGCAPDAEAEAEAALPLCGADAAQPARRSASKRAAKLKICFFISVSSSSIQNIACPRYPFTGRTYHTTFRACCQPCQPRRAGSSASTAV